MNDRTAQELKDGYYEDDSETGVCLDCREHATFHVFIDDEGEPIGEEVSSCCGGNIHRF